jgi:hypothetical protein
MVSYKVMPAATETFKLLTDPSIGIENKVSQVRRKFIFSF